MNIDNIIKENINKVILREHYHGPLYHFTNIYHAAKMIKFNRIDSYMDNSIYNNFPNEPSISFTRNKLFSFRSNEPVSVSFKFDADTIMNIRGAKLMPINYFNSRNMPRDYLDDDYEYNLKTDEDIRNKIDDLYNKSNRLDKHKYFEFEERLYGVKTIEPLNEYVEEVKIYLTNKSLDPINKWDQIDTGIETTDLDLVAENTGQLFGQGKLTVIELINDILKNPLFKDKIKIVR